MSEVFNCTQVDALLCEYLDGTISQTEQALLYAHLVGCPSCLALVEDASAGMKFLTSAAPVEPPQELITRILFHVPDKRDLRPRVGVSGWFTRLFDPILQPRYAMGAMLTVLSLAMMTRCAGVPQKPLSAADLDPVRIVGVFGDRLHRTWQRTVKTYESMRLVYEVQTRVNEWRDQQQDNPVKDRTKDLNAKPDPSRKLPTKASGDAQPNAAPSNSPNKSSNPNVTN